MPSAQVECGRSSSVPCAVRQSPRGSSPLSLHGGQRRSEGGGRTAFVSFGPLRGGGSGWHCCTRPPDVAERDRNVLGGSGRDCCWLILCAAHARMRGATPVGAWRLGLGDEGRFFARVGAQLMLPLPPSCGVAREVGAGTKGVRGRSGRHEVAGPVSGPACRGLAGRHGSVPSGLGRRLPSAPDWFAVVHRKVLGVLKGRRGAHLQHPSAPPSVRF